MNKTKRNNQLVKIQYRKLQFLVPRESQQDFEYAKLLLFLGEIEVEDLIWLVVDLYKKYKLKNYH